jgi:hypothetical protein
MVKKIFIMEKERFNFEEKFFGDWNLFEKVVANPETIFIFDTDGILANSPKVVFKMFNEKYGVHADPAEMDRQYYLTYLANELNLGKDAVEHAEDNWYKPEVLLRAQRYLWAKPIILKVINGHGYDGCKILTSRNPSFKKITLNWYSREIPEIRHENILIRNEKFDGHSAEFKVQSVESLAKKAPWVVFIDDFDKFCHSVLDADVKNCLVIYAPWGKIVPRPNHERLVVVGRHPQSLQAMYPLYDAINRALVAHS